MLQEGKLEQKEGISWDRKNILSQLFSHYYFSFTGIDNFHKQYVVKKEFLKKKSSVIHPKKEKKDIYCQRDGCFLPKNNIFCQNQPQSTV